MESPDLSVSLCGLHFRNPVFVASGTFAYGREMARLYDLACLGALVSKTITRAPRAGNPPPRIAETAGGMLNSIGLANPGLVSFLSTFLPQLSDAGCPIIVNIAGEDVDDYVSLCCAVEDAANEAVSAIELNISCPNVSHGLNYGTDPELAGELVQKVKASCSLPAIAKLTPNVTDIAEVARAVEQAGANAVSVMNTLVGMAVDVDRRRPVLGNVTGGLSGPAVKPVGLAAVWKTSQAVEIPVIGIGGIMEARDVLEYLMVGATAVQIGTANFVDPWVAPKIIEGLGQWCTEHAVPNLQSIIGTLEIDAQ